MMFKLGGRDSRCLPLFIHSTNGSCVPAVSQAHGVPRDSDKLPNLGRGDN